MTTVTAVTPCELLKLKKSSFLKAIENYPEILEKIHTNAQNKLLDPNR